MSDRSRGEGLSRRDFVGTGAAGLSTAALGSAALSATLLPPARTKADAPEASDVAPTDAAPTDAAPTRRSRTTPEAVLVRGLPESVGGHTIVDARLHLGSVAVRMRAPDGSAYQVDVLRRAEGEPARGVRETAGYALFLANRGDGGTRTHEAHGLGLMALAAWLARHESVLAGHALASHGERRAAHPNGAFLVV